MRLWCARNVLSVLFSKNFTSDDFSHFFLSYSRLYRSSSSPPYYMCHPLSFSHLVRQQRQCWCCCCWFYWHQLILSCIFYDILLHESASFNFTSIRLWIFSTLKTFSFESVVVVVLASKNLVRCVWVRKYEKRLWSSWILRLGGKLLGAIIGHNPNCMSADRQPHSILKWLIFVGRKINFSF